MNESLSFIDVGPDRWATGPNGTFLHSISLKSFHFLLDPTAEVL